MNRSKYFITNKIAVDQRFALELKANHFQSGRPDDSTFVMAAPGLLENSGNIIIYGGTNGDPVFLGWIDSDDGVNLADEIASTFGEAYAADFFPLVSADDEGDFRAAIEEEIRTLWEVAHA